MLFSINLYYELPTASGILLRCLVVLCQIQLAETRKLCLDEKDEEVRLLERSVEELERTVNVLESKVSSSSQMIKPLLFH